MRGGRFSEEQIVAVLKEQEVGSKTSEVCRKHGISGATFHKTNAKLKKLLAETMLDNAILKESPARNHLLSRSGLSV